MEKVKMKLSKKTTGRHLSLYGQLLHECSILLPQNFYIRNLQAISYDQFYDLLLVLQSHNL